MVNAIADAVEENAISLASLLTTEQGKPLAEAHLEVEATIDYFRYYATLAPVTEVIQDDETQYIETRHDPLGVVAAIVPWNFPLLMPCWKLGPALVAGNTIVLKTAPTTPAIGLKLGELVKDIFPAGVVNVIADDNDLGPLLTSHPDVAKVSFTGSAATGRKIMASSADTLKRLTLELGGNDAAIILPDVDVAATAPHIAGLGFYNAGQTCIAIKRVYIHADIYDEMCAAMAAVVSSMPVGDGLTEGTAVGPVQNRPQYEKVRALIEEAEGERKGYSWR